VQAPFSTENLRRWHCRALLGLTAGGVFSSMTSFTQCSGTSFTLLRERSDAGARSRMDGEERGTFRNNGCGS